MGMTDTINRPTNKPTISQLMIREGDAVNVIKDDGDIHAGYARSNPYVLGGHTWVIMVSGIVGAYDLTRCHEVSTAS